MDRVLLVDDDVQLCKLLAERLATEGFSMDTVHDGSRGLECALSMEYALVVLDLMLPGMGGLDVLRRLRKVSPVPVLILTARGEDSDRILGLEMERTTIFPSLSTRGNSSLASAPSCGEPVEPRPLADPWLSAICASIQPCARCG